jgi:hypothetical protein
MGFNSSGVYTPPIGAENASPGNVIRSAVWNTIFTDLATSLSQLGTQAWVNTPYNAVGSFTVTAGMAVVLVTASTPTITLPLSVNKQGPVSIVGTASTIFGTAKSVLVGTAGETISGAATYTLSTNYGVTILYPLSAGGYIAK